MPITPATTANDALRAYVQAHGNQPWTPAELAELARLRSAWMVARRHGYTTAA